MLVFSNKIQVGISACMFGAKVRYNQKGWEMTKHMGRDKEMFIFHPMCPEVMSGMGVPRKSIKIKGEHGFAVWNNRADIVDSSGKNWTFAIKDAVKDVMKLTQKRELQAYIYMEGSPTCGVYRTTLKNKRLGKPPGVLGAKLLDSGLFLISATDLQSPIKWWDIKRRLLAFLYLDSLELNNKADVYAMWHHYKFICQELNEKWAREQGHAIANIKEMDAAFIAGLKQDILMQLRMPSTLPKIKQMLWKHYSFLRKHKQIEIDNIQEPTDLRGMHVLAKELIDMTLTSYNEDMVYGQVPVIYRR